MKFTCITILFITIFCFITYSTAAQEHFIVQGVVNDTLNAPIAQASFVVSAVQNKGEIIAFTTSNSNGEFSLRLPKVTVNDTLSITCRHLAFATKTLRVIDKSKALFFILSPKVNALKQVVLEAKKSLTVKGDTITYTVKGLQKTKDYTIEEVIERIPGVVISENGQISYNNKAISHLYINGVDLLEGRYSVATKGIPADAVNTIEILKKHNHALIDKGVTNSNNVAFNITIKKDRSIIFGSTKGDIGVPFVTGKAEITPIIIKNKIQDIASFKINNIGESLSYNGANLTNNLSALDAIKLEHVDVLTAPNTSGYGLSSKYWLDNEALAFTNNVLLKTDKEVILKVAVNYNTTNTTIEKASNTSYFFEDEVTAVNKTTTDNLNTHNYSADVVSEINKKTIYLKNKLLVNGTQSRGASFIVQNNLPLSYNYNKTNLNLSNALEFKTTVNNNILNSALLFEVANYKANTVTSPSVFNASIPSDFVALKTNQNAQSMQANIGGFSNYIVDIGKLKLVLNQSLKYSSENLMSHLFKENDNEQTQFAYPFKSDFNLKTLKTITAINTQFSFKKMTFDIGSNLMFLNLNQKELLNSAINKQRYFLFLQPECNMFYKINQNWDFNFSLAHTARVSNFSQLYNGLILKNYASLVQNPNNFNVFKNVSSSLYFSNKNIVKGLFFNNATTVSRETSRFTFATTLDANGLVEVNATNLPNQSLLLNNSTRFTKRVFKILKTELEYTFNHQISEQLFNGTFQTNINNSHTATVELDLDENTWYALKYKGLLNYGISKINTLKNTNTFLKHNLQLDFYTTKKSRINLELESVKTAFSTSNVKNNNSVFNTSFYYKPSKKLFLRASLINMFNTRFFSSIFNNTNSISQAQFALRERQFTIEFNYSL